MSKFGFLSVLEEEMDKHFRYDYALDWDKKNHAIELSFILEVDNSAGLLATDDGEEIDEAVALEEFVLFYNQDKSRFDQEDYLTALPFDPKKGYSREFLAYFAQFLNRVADQGMADIQAFLADEAAEDFTMTWDAAAFDNGRADLQETDFYPYPRY